MLPPPNEDTRIAELQRRVDNLESALRAAFTTISGGRGLTISGGGEVTVKGGRLRALYPDNMGGEVGVYFGDVYDAIDGDYQGTGILVQDADGTDIAVFRSDTSGRPLVQIRDSGENTVFATDLTTGQGLGRPFLRGELFPAKFVNWTVSTTSATFETLLTGIGDYQHAGIMGWARASMDTAATSGELRFLVNGTQVGADLTWGFGLSTQFFLPTVPVADHEEFITVEIQGRVTVGTGALKVGGGGWFGRPIS